MTKKNHLETRIVVGRIKDDKGKWKKANIALDFISAPKKQIAFNEDQTRKIRELLTPRPGFNPPSDFDPIEEIVYAFKFFFSYKKRMEFPLRKKRQDLKNFEKCFLRQGLEIQELEGMDELSLKELGFPPDWPEQKAKESFELSRQATARLKNLPERGRRFETEKLHLTCRMIDIFEKATDKTATSGGSTKQYSDDYRDDEGVICPDNENLLVDLERCQWNQANDPFPACPTCPNRNTSKLPTLKPIFGGDFFRFYKYCLECIEPSLFPSDYALNKNIENALKSLGRLPIHKKHRKK